MSKQNGNVGSPLPLLTPGAVIFLGERKIGRGVGGVLSSLLPLSFFFPKPYLMHMEVRRPGMEAMPPQP